MAKLGAVNVIGKSGEIYKFRAYSLDTLFRKRRPAVVLVTRRRQIGPDGPFKHRQLAVAQTDDLRQLMAEQPPLDRPRTANCICVYAETDGARRLAIQNDVRLH